MTKSHEPDELKISRLYDARKQRYQAPAASKRVVLRHHQASHKASTTWLNRFQMLAIASATILLVSLVAINHYSMQHSDAPIKYTWVEIHSMEDEATDQFANIRHRYSTLYNDYLQQQHVLLTHHNRNALLSQLDDGWELRTCDNELVKISRELVAQLTQMNLVSDTLKSGDRVNIEFNQSGLIVGIFANKNLPQC